jgi:hypothetical protein
MAGGEAVQVLDGHTKSYGIRCGWRGAHNCEAQR